MNTVLFIRRCRVRMEQKICTFAHGTHSFPHFERDVGFNIAHFRFGNYPDLHSFNRMNLNENVKNCV